MVMSKAALSTITVPFSLITVIFNSLSKEVEYNCFLRDYCLTCECSRYHSSPVTAQWRGRGRQHPADVAIALLAPWPLNSHTIILSNVMLSPAEDGIPYGDSLVRSGLKSYNLETSGSSDITFAAVERSCAVITPMALYHSRHLQILTASDFKLL